MWRCFALGRLKRAEAGAVIKMDTGLYTHAGVSHTHTHTHTHTPHKVLYIALLIRALPFPVVRGFNPIYCSPLKGPRHKALRGLKSFKECTLSKNPRTREDVYETYTYSCICQNQVRVSALVTDWKAFIYVSGPHKDRNTHTQTHTLPKSVFKVHSVHSRPVIIIMNNYWRSQGVNICLLSYLSLFWQRRKTKMFKMISSPLVKTWN